MIMRFRYMLPVIDKAASQIRRGIRDLAGSDIEKYKLLCSQFHIIDYRDIYVADDMEPDDRGYILKCIRGLGLHEGTAEYLSSPR